MKRFLCLWVALIGLVLTGIGISETISNGWKVGQDLVTTGLLVTVLVIIFLPAREKEERRPQQPPHKP